MLGEKIRLGGTPMVHKSSLKAYVQNEPPLADNYSIIHILKNIKKNKQEFTIL